MRADRRWGGPIVRFLRRPDRPLHHPLPGRTARVRIAAVGAVAILLGLLVALLVWALPETVRAFDEPVGRFFRDLALDRPLLEGWATVWSFAAAGVRNVAIVGVASVVLVIAGAWRWAAFLVVLTQAGVLASNLLKVTIARGRPELVAQSPGQESLSFPSGHSFAGMTVWGSLALICLYLLPRPWGRVAAGACVAIGVLQPVARLLLARHWPTDVIGGQLLGLGWLLLGWAIFTTIRSRGGAGTAAGGVAG